jgi:hypothetical protein
MRNLTTVLLSSVTAAVLFAGLALASTTTKTVDILNRVQVAGKTIAPGMYRVELNTSTTTPTLEFYRHNKEVAQTPVKLVPSRGRNQQTEVKYNTANNQDVITEIDFSGAHQRMVLQNNPS